MRASDTMDSKLYLAENVLNERRTVGLPRVQPLLSTISSLTGHLSLIEPRAESPCQPCETVRFAPFDRVNHPVLMHASPVLGFSMSSTVMRMRRSRRVSMLPTSSREFKKHRSHQRPTDMRTTTMRLCRAAPTCLAQCPIRTACLTPSASPQSY